MLASCAATGVSILLTTHHLEEAEQRCERIVIIDHGKIVAAGTLQELVDDGRAHRLRHAPDRRWRRHGRRSHAADAGVGVDRCADACAREVTDVGARRCRALLERVRRRRRRRRRRGRAPARRYRTCSSHLTGGSCESNAGPCCASAWMNLRRDRVAQALTFLLPIIFFSIFASVFGSQRSDDSRRGSRSRWSTRIDRSSRERVVEALQKEKRAACSRRGPERGQGDCSIARRAERAGARTATFRSPSSSRKASERLRGSSGFARGPRVDGPAACRSCPIRSRRRWCRDCCRKSDYGCARSGDAGRHDAVREVRRRADAATAHSRSTSGLRAEGERASACGEHGRRRRRDGHAVADRQRHAAPTIGTGSLISFYAAGIGVMFLLFSWSARRRLAARGGRSRHARAALSTHRRHDRRARRQVALSHADRLRAADGDVPVGRAWCSACRCCSHLPGFS